MCRYGIFIESDGDDVFAVADKARELCREQGNQLWQICDLDTGKCVVVDLETNEIKEVKVVKL